MVAGSLPTFFDVSNAFTARPMEEDTLIHQAAAAGLSLTFMGDATWHNLFPTQFNTSLPFPCFNVKDLDTVDDGIWKHLIPSLSTATVDHPASRWDIFVAHYLGVDHAGHAHGVGSPQMGDKLRQMDDHVKAIVDALVSGADADDTLLLIAGDHGQTLGGDHGGGSPEEVDSVLVAIDIGKLKRSKENNDENIDDSGALLSLQAACRQNCTCGDDANQCADDLPQINAVPTLASMLNLPVPFGNLGQLSPDLWSLAADRCSSSSSNSDDDPTTVYASSLARATRANAVQVHRYLNTYAAHPTSRFPASDLHRLNLLFNITLRTNDAWEGHVEYLKQAVHVAQNVWTQFHELSMMAGLGLFLGVVLWQLHCTLTCMPDSSNGSTQFPVSIITRAVPLAGILIHSLGIFSFFYLLSEGKSVATVLAVTLVLVVVVSMQQQQQQQSHRRSNTRGRNKIVVAVGVSLISLFLCCWLGLIRHSGYGFWQRLTATVHEPQDLQGMYDGDEVKTEGSGREQSSSSAAVVVLAKHLAVYTIPVAILWWWWEGRGGRGWQQVGVQRQNNKSPTLLIRVKTALSTSSYVLLSAYFAVHHLSTLGQAGNVEEEEEKEALPASPQTLPMDQFLARILLFLVPFNIALSALVPPTPSHPTSSDAFVSELSGLLLPLLLLISTHFTPLLALAFSILLASILSSTSTSTSIACVFSLLQTLAFFITGHLCEFAGLQYTAGFVGYEEFDLVRSGVLVALDTFGAMAIVALVLYSSSSLFATGSTSTNASAIKMHMLLVFGLGRSMAALCAALSAGIQRRHLYAWALFAPKFAFEVFFLVCTDILLIGLAFAAARLDNFERDDDDDDARRRKKTT